MEILTHRLPDFDTLEIYPIADIHIGDPKTDEAAFKKFIKYIKEQPNRYIILNGDLMNNAIKSSVSNVYNEQYPPGEQKYILYEILKDVSDRILCILPGNHEARDSKEVDKCPIKDLAYMLQIPHLYKENGAYLNIQFGKDRHGRYLSYTAYVVHGVGGGKRAGAPANVLEMLPLSFIADFYVIGHMHRKLGFKNTYFRPNATWDKLEQHERAFVISAPWQFFGGYAERKLYTPQSKGATWLELNGKEKGIKIVI